MKGRASHGRQVPVPHVIPWFLWMSHCPQPIGLFNGIPQSSGFEHTSTGAYPAFLRFTGNVVPPFEEPRGSQLRLMRYSSHKPGFSRGVVDHSFSANSAMRDRHTFGSSTRPNRASPLKACITRFKPLLSPPNIASST